MKLASSSCRNLSSSRRRPRPPLPFFPLSSCRLFSSFHIPSQESPHGDHGLAPRVCGMVILHRHGERAPMVNFYKNGDEMDAAASEEERRWIKKLPTAQELEMLQTYFPVQSVAARVPRDRASKPFGCLTENGLEGMRELGRGIKKLHSRLLDNKQQQQQPEEAATGASPLVQFDVFSSNFSRTQQSAQGLLHGLAAHELCGGSQVPVVVRQEKDCTIHMYDNNPSNIQEEVGKVLNAHSFLARQDEQEALKSDLARLIPGLRKDDFKWMEAFDFFLCQPADAEMSPQLQALRRPTMEYVAWRFQQYYNHRPLLGLVIAPLVREIIGTLQRMAEADAARIAGDAAFPFKKDSAHCHVAIFSGHDVTVLALLHALDWPLVRDPAWWPPYGCALVFELLEPSSSSSRGTGDYRVRIRVEKTGRRFPVSLPIFPGDSSFGGDDAVTEEDDGLPLSDLVLWFQEEQGLLEGKK